MRSLNLGKPNLQIFADTLLSLAETDPNILVLTSDSRGSARLVAFGQKLPQQTIEMGIAEQNLVGVAAGLASAGKKVFAVSPACFLTTRSLEQIKNDVAYSDQPVKVIGISAGISYGALGTTHHSLHDLAALQAFHNIDIVLPADNFETEQAIRAAVNYPHPLYIRFGKKAMYDLHSAGTEFQIGKAILLRYGSDVTFIATGETVHPAFMAAELLSEQGISSNVLSLHTLRPLDDKVIMQTVASSKVLVTVEEHSVNGGLGSRIASLILQNGLWRPTRIVGIPDESTMTGSQSDVFNYYGISADGLAKTATMLLQQLAKA